VITPVGSDFRLLRKLYNNLLGPQQSATFRKYQDYESKVMMEALLTRPQGFLDDTERFAMSVIFSACYGVRLAELDHPVMKEFYGVWEVMLKCETPLSHFTDAQRSNMSYQQSFSQAPFLSTSSPFFNDFHIRCSLG
jgi:hypothetical protein